MRRPRRESEGQRLTVADARQRIDQGLAGGRLPKRFGGASPCWEGESSATALNRGSLRSAGSQLIALALSAPFSGAQAEASFEHKIEQARRLVPAFKRDFYNLEFGCRQQFLRPQK